MAVAVDPAYPWADLPVSVVAVLQGLVYESSKCDLTSQQRVLAGLRRMHARGFSGDNVHPVACRW